MGYFLASPWRRKRHHPEQLLQPYLAENMKVMDIGCGMGFFSLPMAKMVGGGGRVICIDLQKQMIGALKKKADKAGLSTQIETRVCSKNSLQIADLSGQIDFALAFGVVHELPHPEHSLTEIKTALKKNGVLLIAEPSHHVTEEEFDLTMKIARNIGFQVKKHLDIKDCLAVLLEQT
jgi:ubiquinone/menaquinone biosynthesis C-methylase UbiE